MPRSATALLLRDELVGFAKSKVMIVLWVVLPLIAMAAYLLLPRELTDHQGSSRTATQFISLIISSLASAVAALMVAVDIVTERNRKVYELFVIRPIKRDAIIWSKFIAVFACVSVACIAAIGLGLAVDAVRGSVPTSSDLVEIGKSLASSIAVIAIACGVGVLFGVLAKSVLAAVILVLYIGQNLAAVPMLPIYFGILPDSFWLMMAISYGLALLLAFVAARTFRRAEF